MIHQYFDYYTTYKNNEWKWQLSQDSNDIYMEYRARKSKDIIPDFTSLEKDAEALNLCRYTWTDCFGCKWEGVKGKSVLIKSIDYSYDGKLFYWSKDEEEYEYEYEKMPIESDYSLENLPPSEIYSKISNYLGNTWVDFKNVISADYSYIVDNHIFKDTHITLKYEDEEILVFNDYKIVLNSLIKCGHQDIADKILQQMDEHFLKLKNSKNGEIKTMYDIHINGQTAKKYLKL